MKNLILSLLLFSLFVTSCENKEDIIPNNDENKEDTITSNCNFINFYYYNKAQNYLGELSNDYIVIGIDTIHSDSEIRNFISTINLFDPKYSYTIYKFGLYKFKEIPLKFNSPKSCEEITQIISDLEKNKIISYVHYTIQTNSCLNFYGEPTGNLCVRSYGSSFYVKVFDKNDLTALNQMIEETNTELDYQLYFLENWYKLRATKKSKGDGLAMANFFYESGLFQYCEPDITKYPVE